jgi:2,3-bisphosphoglycerate-independent phosphoglycerate mutase
MGNSEVGHMTIGSGRVHDQDLPRINKAFDSGKVFDNQHIKAVIKALKHTNKHCHIIGLTSDGGVHSHINHQLALAQHLQQQGVQVWLHVITDGRDTSPKSGYEFVKQAEAVTPVATVSGRYYAMDRDKRFERTEEAYQVIAKGANKQFRDASSAVQQAYEADITDEFIKPQSSTDYQGMMDGDAIICTNFRSDRMRQLCDALFVSGRIDLSHAITLTSYSSTIDQHASVLFPQLQTEHNLSQVLSEHGISQFRIAETEKYPHITFFFNSGKESPDPLETRVLIDSPKVATYDLAPQMSVLEVTDKLEQAILSKSHGFYLVNYANADMVGHTGNFKATVTAIKTIDACLKRIYEAVKKIGGALIITADHGNAEQMFDHANHLPSTTHSTNPVPFVLVSEAHKRARVNNGGLADIAPTILGLYGINKPIEMTGKDLVNK